MRTSVILGAGFSKNSGLPIQSEIPALLINNKIENHFERSISTIIKRFMEDVFSFRHDVYPGLDDLLNCIDISVNSGHHLGLKYSSRHLWALRRFIVYRILSILEEHFKYSMDVDRLIRLLIKDSIDDTGFVVLNWDTVLERYITNINPGMEIDYSNGGKKLNGDREVNLSQLKNDRSPLSDPLGIKLIKVHGSCNWLYCDNCRALINDLKCEIPPLKKAGIKKADFELFDITDIDGFFEDTRCHTCGDTVSSHIATPYYRKSFRENSFPGIWSEAEDLLTKSEKWVFIGYSLPQADYEFKHLLKICELKLKHKKDKKLSIDVVLLNSKTTTTKYKSFFGDRICSIFNGGIGEYINSLQKGYLFMQ